MARGLVNPVGHRGLVDDNPPGGGGGVSTTTVTSEDHSVVVTATPTGVDLSVPNANLASEVLIALLNMGSGNPETPDSGLWVDPEDDTVFYLSGATVADTANQHGQVTLYPIPVLITGLRLIGWIDSMSLPSTGGDVTATFTIMVWDGAALVETLLHQVTGFLTTNLYFDVQTSIALPPGTAAGLRVSFTSNLTDGGQNRGSFRVIGLAPTAALELPTHLLTLDVAPALGGVFDSGTLDVTELPNQAPTGAALNADPVAPFFSKAPTYVPDGLAPGLASMSCVNAFGGASAILGQIKDDGGPNQGLLASGIARTFFALVKPTTANAHNSPLNLHIPTFATDPQVQYIAPTISAQDVYQKRSGGFWEAAPATPVNYTNQWVLMEWKVLADGGNAGNGTLSLRVNGIPIPLTATDPGSGCFPSTGYFIGYSGDASSFEFGRGTYYDGHTTDEQDALARLYLMQWAELI